MKILVLGGAGYIGSHTVYELIDAGEEVVIIDNLETGHIEAVHPQAKFYKGDLRDKDFVDSVLDQENEEMGTRQVPFSRELYIEREDFKIEKPKKYRRLYVGNEVRLMNAYFVTCTGYDVDEDGNVTCVYATYDPESRGGNSPDGRKVRGTIHWVSVPTAKKAEIRLYENIVDEEKGVYNEDGSINVNPNSLTVIKEAYVEPELEKYDKEDSFQFMRTGYFCLDSKDSTKEHMVFNRIVSLKSSYKPN